MWQYAQPTGEIDHNSIFECVGYSGHAAGRNNPAMEADHDVGPIPRGLYKMGTPIHHPELGPIAIPLTPVGHDALGRTGFFCHGNNKKNDASKGCIIAGPRNRDDMATSIAMGDDELTVV